MSTNNAQERFNKLRGKVSPVRVILPQHDAAGLTPDVTAPERLAYARPLPSGWNRTHDGLYWHVGNSGKLYPRIPRTAAEVYPNLDNDLPPGFSPDTTGASAKGNGARTLAEWAEW